MRPGRGGWAWRGTVAAALLAGAAAAAPPLTTAREDVRARFERFKADRRQMLDELVVPIEACVRRRDTEHVAFHGCLDWHSSVHGTWALTKYGALTGDARFRPLLREVLAPDKVSAELGFLRQHPAFEMPYGRAWFLRLALDHRAASGSELLQPMGDFVARSLVDHYRRSPPRPTSPSYDNASWALINLYDYGVSRGDQGLVAFVREAARQHFVEVARPCPILNEEGRWPDFMPLCTTWAYLVSHVAPPADLGGWLERFLPPGARISPISQPRGAHHMGTNFSRSWGFWRLYTATGDPRYLGLYLDHFERQYRHPEWWRGDYRTVGHWVAQFGVFALAPVFAE